MFGLLEVNGPIKAVFKTEEARAMALREKKEADQMDRLFTLSKDPNDTTGALNPYSWHRKANMIYVDNPVGSGYREGQCHAV